jgi:hypothetical protein
MKFTIRRKGFLKLRVRKNKYTIQKNVEQTGAINKPFGFNFLDRKGNLVYELKDNPSSANMKKNWDFALLNVLTGETSGRVTRFHRKTLGSWKDIFGTTTIIAEGLTGIIHGKLVAWVFTKDEENIPEIIVAPQKNTVVESIINFFVTNRKCRFRLLIDKKYVTTINGSMNPSFTRLSFDIPDDYANQLDLDEVLILLTLMGGMESQQS